MSYMDEVVRVRVACCVTSSGWSIACGAPVSGDGSVCGYTDPETLLSEWGMLEEMPDNPARFCWIDSVVPKPKPKPADPEVVEGVAT